MNQEAKNTVRQSLASLEAWIAANGWAGYDPYDIRGQEWFVRLFGHQTWFFRKLRGVLSLVEANLPPHALRKALRIKKEINPKGMGLFASAYIELFRQTANSEYLQKAESILAWLRSNSNASFPGASWGYPFHWQSRIFIPKGTPSSVVTGTVGDAWLDHYEITGSETSLDVIRRIAVFFRRALHRFEREKNEVCFSYTPIDDFKVHNASLFVAAFLARYGKLTGDSDALRTAVDAARYTINEQNTDGSFYYWSLEPDSIIDHYHTGFVLRHLDTVYRRTGARFIEEPLRRGYTFYLEHLFAEETMPKFSPDSLYPIDIHSCAEAIVCIAQLGPTYGGLERLPRVFDFIDSTMRSHNGYFIAEIRRRLWSERKLVVPYIRWGQAWMLLALSRLQGTIVDDKDE